MGLINFLAVRYQTRIDFTENQKFTLSPQTIEVLENLEQPVKLWIFDRGENPQYTQVIENYQRRGNGKFRFELVDPQTQPGKANQFGVKQLGEIHLEVGDKKEVIISRQLEPLTESKLTNSIEKILGSRILKIYFIQGHGERELEEGQKGFSEAVNALESKNYIIESINLATISQVPEDAEVKEVELVFYWHKAFLYDLRYDDGNVILVLQSIIPLVALLLCLFNFLNDWLKIVK